MADTGEGSMETGEEQETCFICMESCKDNVRDICLCKSLVCHPTCQLEMMRNIGSVRCRVCATDFKNAGIKRRLILSNSGKFGLLISFCMMCCTVVTFTIYCFDGLLILLVETLCLLAGVLGFLIALLRTKSTFEIQSTIFLLDTS